MDDEQSLWSLFLAVSSEFDERGLLDELEPGDRNLVERRLRDEMIAGIVTLRWGATSRSSSSSCPSTGSVGVRG